ncbi:MAG TPA: methyltransferase domain-containing protein [Stellaceae bacterium]|jgi:trans-aconitate 2-methyltransferase
MAWNPQQYLKFAGERLRPGFDLLAQIDDLPSGPLFDLGCGTGPHARAIAARWPERSVTGIDNSTPMLAEAAKEPSPIAWLHADVATWQTPAPAALIYSNATLQWLSRHERLFPRLIAMLAPAGVLAVQMPRNFDNPSQSLLRETAASGPWAAVLAPLFAPDSAIPSMLRPNPVRLADFYYDLLAPLAKGGIDLWETEYVHQLQGENAVLEWMRGTTLRPVLDALNEPLRTVFLDAYAAKLAAAFPRRDDGKTLLKFRRLFIVARA